MQYSGFNYTYEHGSVRGTTYHIGARLDPNANNVESFAILLFFALPSGEVVHVAKVDDKEHDEGTIHVHRNYRERGMQVRDFEVNLSGWIDAEGYLRKNAERMVREYLDNHGKQPRGDL